MSNIVVGNINSMLSEGELCTLPILADTVDLNRNPGLAVMYIKDKVSFIVNMGTGLTLGFDEPVSVKEN